MQNFIKVWRSQLEKLVQPFIDRTLEICDKTIEKAGIKTADID
jgi:molecular chaperone DnaK